MVNVRLYSHLFTDVLLRSPLVKSPKKAVIAVIARVNVLLTCFSFGVPKGVVVLLGIVRHPASRLHRTARHGANAVG
jgi:hypothetical protein